MSINFQDRYLLASPAGAFYCCAANDNEPARRFLQQIMSRDETPHFDAQTLESLFVDPALQEDILFHIQKLKWLQGFKQPRKIVPGPFEETLPERLAKLSSDHKALLADDQGFYLAGSGFTHEASEELSALGADLSSLYARHKGILSNNLNIKSNAFALVDAAGFSQLGFWPLHIGELTFNLILSGAPRLNQNAFVELIWILHKRYYSQPSISDSDAA